MNEMENGLKKYLTTEELTIIRSVRIGVAGCGGLGSNTAHNLVRLGFRNFLLIDFDHIENTNLNRQFYFLDQIGMIKCEALKMNLQKINPDLNIETKQIKVEKNNIKSLFKNCDLIVEGFDKVEYKTLLIEELSPEIPSVSATGLGNYWNVDNISTRRINKNLIVIGDMESDVDKGVSPLSPGVTIAAAKQAAGILKLTLEIVNEKNNR